MSHQYTRPIHMSTGRVLKAQRFESYVLARYHVDLEQFHRQLTPSKSGFQRKHNDVPLTIAVCTSAVAKCCASSTWSDARHGYHWDHMVYIQHLLRATCGIFGFTSQVGLDRKIRHCGLSRWYSYNPYMLGHISGCLDFPAGSVSAAISPSIHAIVERSR